MLNHRLKLLFLNISELERVVEDLRENVLKQKYQVSVDDVECYALALSQLSRQLVGIKGAFAGLKDQMKPTAQNSPEQRSVHILYQSPTF